MKTNILFYLLIMAVSLFTFSCKEEGRYIPESGASEAPKPVENITYEPLYGGARFHYTVPDSKDLLSINAEYTNSKNKTFRFSASYYVDSLDIYGLPDQEEHDIKIYTTNRAGEKSEPTIVRVTPLEPAFTRVAKNLFVKPGFSSLMVDWTNELEQNINIYIYYKYTKDGQDRSYTTVFSSNLEKDRRFVENLFLSPSEPVDVSIQVEDNYGNITDIMPMGQVSLYEDQEVPKGKWVLPETATMIGGVPMCFGNGHEGRTTKVIDGVIDRGDNLNFLHTNSRGRTGDSKDGNMPWNVMIDLGDHYELSRIITIQRHSGGLDNINRGQYYQSENVGMYNMYIWDDDTSEWVYVSQHKIPVPVGLSEIEFVKKGEAGDMAYMFPEEPQYTKPTRWFRYEALKSFNGNYTLEDANCLSEITLYGRKAK
ncbi:MAG: DUF4959 domain-containing protein [Dysgonomonas sp.]